MYSTNSHFSFHPGNDSFPDHNFVNLIIFFFYPLSSWKATSISIFLFSSWPYSIQLHFSYLTSVLVSKSFELHFKNNQVSGLSEFLNFINVTTGCFSYVSCAKAVCSLWLKHQFVFYFFFFFPGKFYLSNQFLISFVYTFLIIIIIIPIAYHIWFRIGGCLKKVWFEDFFLTSAIYHGAWNAHN